MRDSRKRLALAEAVPVYALFTNAQLAEFALEIHIKGSDVGGWRAIGGRLTPASH